jgi:hypothetical protein
MCKTNAKYEDNDLHYLVARIVHKTRHLGPTVGILENSFRSVCGTTTLPRTDILESHYRLMYSHKMYTCSFNGICLCCVEGDLMLQYVTYTCLVVTGQYFVCRPHVVT